MSPFCQDLNKPSSDEQSVSLILITDTFLVKTVFQKNLKLRLMISVYHMYHTYAKNWRSIAATQ